MTGKRSWWNFVKFLIFSILLVFGGGLGFLKIYVEGSGRFYISELQTRPAAESFLGESVLFVFLNFMSVIAVWVFWGLFCRARFNVDEDFYVKVSMIASFIIFFFGILLFTGDMLLIMLRWGAKKELRSLLFCMPALFSVISLFFGIAFWSPPEAGYVFGRISYGLRNFRRKERSS